MPLLKEIFAEPYVTATVMGDIMLPKQAEPERYAKTEDTPAWLGFYGTLETHAARIAAMHEDPEHFDDELEGWERVAASKTENDKFTIVPKEGETTSVVVIEATPSRIEHCDAWEADGGYKRQTVTLASGKEAGVYVLDDEPLRERFARAFANHETLAYARHKPAPGQSAFAWDHEHDVKRDEKGEFASKGAGAAGSPAGEPVAEGKGEAKGDEGTQPDASQAVEPDDSDPGDDQPPASTLADQFSKAMAAAHTQKRAKIGGEEGPNGEWYKGGAWIATTDMPKRQKEKWDKAAKAGRMVEPGKREVPPPGQMPILDTLSRVADFNWRDGSLNQGYLDYRKTSQEDRKRYADLAAKYQSGERYVNALDYPDEMNFSDLANMAMNGLAVPGELVERFAGFRNEDAGKTMRALGMSKKAAPPPAGSSAK